MKGLLVRVGIDSTYGNWNAPVNRGTGEFVYISIPEPESSRRVDLTRSYDEFQVPLGRIGLNLPERLLDQPTHLDPDFEYLTFGDQLQRGSQIEKLKRGDLLVFYAGLKPVDNPRRPLVYAIIGLYVVEEIVGAQGVEESLWHQNAHTRRVPGLSEIVVRAQPEISGRLSRCIPVGEYRDKAYRVRRDLLEAWGDLSIKDGYIQRSVQLPEFLNAQKFHEWFRAQSPVLMAKNNP